MKSFRVESLIVISAELNLVVFDPVVPSVSEQLLTVVRVDPIVVALVMVIEESSAINDPTVSDAPTWVKVVFFMLMVSTALLEIDPGENTESFRMRVVLLVEKAPVRVLHLVRTVTSEVSSVPLVDMPTISTPPIPSKFTAKVNSSPLKMT